MGVVNQKVLSSKTPGEANIPDFEILFALLVYTTAAFIGENGPYWGNVVSHVSQYRQLTCPDQGHCRTFKVKVLSLSAMA
jgi:hypothetical protein